MRRAVLATLLLAPLLAACGGGSKAPLATDPVPDFALQDANPTSTTYLMDVSPRQFVGQVSAYYFGSAL
jgi:hypothetical protein